MDACDIVIEQKIASKTRNAKFLTILADETEWISTAELLSLCYW